MCWCNPNTRTPYCNSNTCQELKKRAHYLDKLEWKLNEALKENERERVYIQSLEERVKVNSTLIRNQATLLRLTQICGSCRNWIGKKSQCRLDKIKRSRRDSCNKYYPLPSQRDYP